MKRWLLLFITCVSAVSFAAGSNAPESGSWENPETGVILHLLSSGQLIIRHADFYGQSWESAANGIRATYLSQENISSTRTIPTKVEGDQLIVSGNTPITGTYQRLTGNQQLIHLTLGRYLGEGGAEFATLIQYDVSNEAVAIDHFDLRNQALPLSANIARPSDSVRAVAYLSNNDGAFALSHGSTNTNTLRLLGWTEPESQPLKTLYYGNVVDETGEVRQVRLHLYDNGMFSRFARTSSGEQERADEGNYQREGDTIMLYSYEKPPLTLQQVGSDLLTVESLDGNVYMGKPEDKLLSFPLDGPIFRFEGLFFPIAGTEGNTGTLNLISCLNGQHYTLVPNRTVQQMIGQFRANPSNGYLQVGIRAHRVPRENGTDDRFWVTDWYRDQALNECPKGMQTFGQIMAANR